MSYQISYRPRAAEEYLVSLEWYKERSIDAGENFVNAINQTLNADAEKPTQLKNTYKHFMK